MGNKANAFCINKTKTQERHLHRNLHINRAKGKNPQIMSCHCAYKSERDTNKDISLREKPNE